MSDASALVQKVWGYCTPLRNAGLSYQDYIEQLTLLLFLKMDDEQTKPPFNRASSIPEHLRWATLVDLDGFDLEAHYARILNELGALDGTLGMIFSRAHNKIEEPSALRRIVHNLIGAENWLSMDRDVKGDLYEGLLAKNAEDVKSGAGQYFTPRVLINAIVQVMNPGPDMRICDPACGTGGFLLAAHRHIVDHHVSSMDKGQLEFLQNEAIRGWELVPATCRVGLMNMILHGLSRPEAEPPITRADALAKSVDAKFDMVLTNPPFGVGNMNMGGDLEGGESDDQEYARDDFWATTSNKQLNFVQHVHSILATDGTAAMVIPDNVLFEGNAGETIRRRLLRECDVHTLLRLPTGIFYRPGVKANVIFFDRKPGSETPWTKNLWIYDLRTNQHFTLKQSPLGPDDLADFVACYRASGRQNRVASERFRCFAYDELVARDKASPDIFWLRDDSLGATDNLPAPAVLAAEIVDDLTAALTEFGAVAESLAARQESAT